MTQDSQHEPIEQIFVNILKDYAYYLKETAKRQDEDIKQGERERRCLEEKIIDDRTRLTKLESDVKNQKDNSDIKIQTGWTVAEKIGAAIAFLIATALAVANLFKN